MSTDLWACFGPGGGAGRAVHPRRWPLARLQGQGLPPWAVMALNNMIMSYVTWAPMYRELQGQDPFSGPALAKQLELVMTVVDAVIEYHPEAQ